ncbi:uncharacterized protein LOC62_07G009373 [Vanrija pseudolonga]|uniref:Elongator complex protein 6 n=1 Tax=Vanrija pseudolonga TaxID=143232 RepID=A0AAF1BM52_9TREE|nr:hypothetical protein LOC62_07G009373 [Vanrija pseudolonga]
MPPTTQAIPLAALLPPSPTAPSEHLRLPAAVLGPLPASSALHAALAGAGAGGALLVTGPKAAFLGALEDEDEGYLRDTCPLGQLEKVQTRHVPSRRHAALLLSLLTGTVAAAGKDAPHEVTPSPSLIVLFDLGALFLLPLDDERENVPMGEEGEKQHVKEREDAPDASSAGYLQLVAAALSAARHLGAGLLVLEPSLASLPVSEGDGAARRVALSDGLEWLFGPGSVATVSDTGDDTYALHLGTETVGLRCRRCARGEYALPPGAGDEGGWQWEWAA